jgi:enoyl-CoA hydratase
MALVDVEDLDGIAFVRLNRPPANALDPELLAAGLAALESLRDAAPSAVVLTGSGAFFSGGADLRIVPALSADEQADMARGINALFSGWHNLPRPLVCAVNGHAIAGGLILALCGDYRVGPTSGQFGLTEVKVGIPFPSAAMEVVQAELVAPVARRLVVRGELFDAETALGFDIFDEVVADDAVVDRSLAVAAELASLPPRTFEAVKARLRAGTPSSRGLFGGAQRTGWVTAEATTAASALLDRSRDDA